MRTSDHLESGAVYTREWLASRFGITDKTLETGIFQPRGHSSVWLFVTERKTPDRTQYLDRLDRDVLSWQGQTAGRKDRLIVEHEANGLELLVFYRVKKYEHPGAGFRVEGRFRYASHQGSRPTTFVLVRVASVADEFLRDLASLRVWRRSTTTAPHKPLLVLLALDRLQRGEPRLADFEEVEGPLRELIELSIPGRRGHPEYPFWRLQSDAIWEVTADKALPDVTVDVSPSVLRQAAARGGFTARFHAALKDCPALVSEARRLALIGIPGDRTGEVLNRVSPVRPVNRASDRLDQPYLSTEGYPEPSPARPGQRDPDAYGRGWRAHRDTQTRLAKFLRDHGSEPRSAATGTAAFDLLWRHSGLTFVAEVKSITDANEERQLRLGLGQVLRYRQACIRAGEPAVAVLVIEREPADSSWHELCSELNVLLVSPADFGACLDADLRADSAVTGARVALAARDVDLRQTTSGRRSERR